MSTPKVILFLGATGGVGLSTLRRSLAANHTCIALCRTPSRLTALLPDPAPANLHVVQGDAHDAAVLAQHLTSPAGSPVDTVIFSIGARPTLRGMSDPHVCEKGMEALLSALRARPEGSPKVRLAAVSSTGISDFSRDLPLAMVPLYKLVLHTAHKDKKAMERLVMAGGDVAEWTLVRGSLYTDGPATEGKVREGMEDPVTGKVESMAVGYTISREDVGKWVFENCVLGGGKWVGKAAVVTY
jgi:nucleoside-diphosphate-sugar epimerase